MHFETLLRLHELSSTNSLKSTMGALRYSLIKKTVFVQRKRAGIQIRVTLVDK